MFRWFEYLVINLIQHNIVVSIGQKCHGQIDIVFDFEHDRLSAFDIINGNQYPFWKLNSLIIYYKN